MLQHLWWIYALLLGLSLLRPTRWMGLKRTQRLSIMILVSLAGLLHQFVFRLYYVTSSSMLPTLGVHDIVLVWLPSGAPLAGQIVVFDQPAKVKRYIAGPGQTVELLGDEVFVDQMLRTDLPTGGGDWGPHQVQPGHFFVLGDNRNNSDDSRISGDIPEKLRVGRAIFRLWPLSSWGRL